jgi:hypothetical protein
MTTSGRNVEQLRCKYKQRNNTCQVLFSIFRKKIFPHPAILPVDNSVSALFSNTWAAIKIFVDPQKILASCSFRVKMRVSSNYRTMGRVNFSLARAHSAIVFWRCAEAGARGTTRHGCT